MGYFAGLFAALRIWMCKGASARELGQEQQDPVRCICAVGGVGSTQEVADTCAIQMY